MKISHIVEQKTDKVEVHIYDKNVTAIIVEHSITKEPLKLYLGVIHNKADMIKAVNRLVEIGYLSKGMITEKEERNLKLIKEHARKRDELNKKRYDGLLKSKVKVSPAELHEYTLPEFPPDDFMFLSQDKYIATDSPVHNVCGDYVYYNSTHRVETKIPFRKGEYAFMGTSDSKQQALFLLGARYYYPVTPAYWFTSYKKDTVGFR